MPEGARKRGDGARGALRLLFTNAAYLAGADGRPGRAAIAYPCNRPRRCGHLLIIPFLSTDNRQVGLLSFSFLTSSNFSAVISF
jgi:hypothetical protein